MSDLVSIYEQNPLVIVATAVAAAVVLYVLSTVLSGDKKKQDAGSSASGEFVIVGRVDEQEPGTMRDITVSTSSGKNAKLLLTRLGDGSYHATSAKCTHQAMSLSKGTLSGTRVTCPLHGACFDVRSGDIEEAPALDALHTFPVRIDGPNVLVERPREDARRRVPTMCGRLDTKSKPIVIIGGGAAGHVAAETLRQEGYDGPLTIICAEKHLPYDRPKLSKSLSATAAAIQLRSDEFYSKHHIDLRLGVKCTGVQSQKHTVSLDDGTTLEYSRLLVCTGGAARRIPCEGHELNNIFVVRDPEDTEQINDVASSAKTCVVVGSSFIGMEAAACLKQAKKLDRVIVVGMEKVPFERVLGLEVGTALQALHESKGIEFRMEAMLSRFVGENGTVTGVELKSGEVLPADMVVLGVGIVCSTQFLKESGWEVERDGSVWADRHMRAKGHPDVWVAGDIARMSIRVGVNELESARIEHWNVAQEHGRVAARDMLGKSARFDSTPFFWTTQYGVSLRYAGHALRYKTVLIRGDVTKRKFAAFYVNDDDTIDAVATLGTDPVAASVAELMRAKRLPLASEIEKHDDPLWVCSLLK